jgi:kynurenine formamidase
MSTTRWKERPPGSNWGDFGPDDQRGRINLLTREKVRQGVAEVSEGIAFCLSLPLDYPGGNLLNPRRHPPELHATARGERINFNFEMASETPGVTDVVCDDLVVLCTQYSTQWDSLAHVGGLFDAGGGGRPEVRYYNGYRGGEDIVGPASTEVNERHSIGATAARALGIENMAASGVQGRGVLVDLRHHFGDEFRSVGFDDLQSVMAADGVVVEPGDMLCLHTGFAQRVLDMGGEPDAETLHHTCSALDGRDEKLLEWITESGIAVLIADNYAVERLPARPGPPGSPAMPLHEHCLFKLGLHLGELWHLTELAEWLRAHNRSRFLLTAPPLRLPGAVGSPATPVATV